MFIPKEKIEYLVDGVEKFKLDNQSNRNLIFMKKELKITCSQENDVWHVEWSEGNVSIGMYGDNKKDALIAFWDYIYDLIPNLEKEKKLSKNLEEKRKFLRKYFYYERGKKYSLNNKIEIKRRKTPNGRIIRSEEEMSMINCPYPYEEEL